MGKHTAGVGRRPLVVTADEQLLDELLRLAAVAGIDLDVVPDVGSAARDWTAASAVLLDCSLLDACAALQLPRRLGVIVVGRDLDDADVWRRSVGVGAEHVVFLPDAADWLVEVMTDLSSAQTARVIALIGGCGGAGASTLAAALAVRAVERDESPVLVDADPFSGGLDLLLGAETCSGVRWQELADVRGRIDHEQLVHALPIDSGLRFLTWSREIAQAPDAEAIRAVISSLARHDGPVLVDAARSTVAAAQPMTVEMLRSSHLAVVVVPARLRAVAAASALYEKLKPIVPDVRFVVRRPAPGGLTSDDIERTLAGSLIGVMPHDSRRAEWEENGLLPAVTGSLRRLCDDILDCQLAARQAA
ncbi:MAG TPA: septum site-determining protein Ssd [Actinomycetes bacterium]|nr:septum site-determining protein Ssd [Actinomycetes bacterium]